MLLTVPWALSLWAGRVDLDGDGRANYARRPKLGKDRGFGECGVSPGPQVRSGAKIMLLTLLSYLIIQGPAFFMSGASRSKVAANEKSWALLGLITTLGGFFAYLWYQVKSSHAQDFQAKKQEAVMKTMLESGQVSLAGAMAGLVYASHDPLAGGNEGGYGTNQLDQDVKAKISEVVRPFFRKFDASGDGHLDKGEIKAVFHDLGEEPSANRLDESFDELDHDKNGTIDFDEFVTGIWSHVHSTCDEGVTLCEIVLPPVAHHSSAKDLLYELADDCNMAYEDTDPRVDDDAHDIVSSVLLKSGIFYVRIVEHSGHVNICFRGTDSTAAAWKDLQSARPAKLSDYWDLNDEDDLQVGSGFLDFVHAIYSEVDAKIKDYIIQDKHNGS